MDNKSSVWDFKPYYNIHEQNNKDSNDEQPYNDLNIKRKFMSNS